MDTGGGAAQYRLGWLLVFKSYICIYMCVTAAARKKFFIILIFLCFYMYIYDVQCKIIIPLSLCNAAAACRAAAQYVLCLVS